MLRKFLSFCLSFLILAQTVPVSAITNITTPSEQASQVPSSIFDGSRPSGGFGPSSPVSPGSGNRTHRNLGTIASGPFGDSFGTDPMLGKPTRRRSAPRAPRNERPADSNNNKTPSRPNTTDSDYNTRERGSAEPDHAGAGILAVATAIAAMIGLGTGASWAGILINVSLGAIAGVVAVALLFTNPSRGLFSGIIDSFSFGANPAKALATDKDNKEEPLNPFYEATYYLARTALLLASLAFVPLALTGAISVSLPVLIAGSALSGLNILSTAVGLISKDSSNQESSIKPIPSPESLSLEGRGQGEGDRSIPLKLPPEQLQAQRQQALHNKQENHIAFESLSPDITPDDKAKKYPDDDRAWEHIKGEGKPAVQKLFTIRTNPNRPPAVTTRGFGADNNTHYGIDINAPKGSVVTSEQEATVLYARYHKNNNQHYQDEGVTEGLGNAVILYPPNTTRLVVYQHFGNKAVSYDEKGKAERGGGYIAGTDKEGSGLLVQEGETIKPGTPIGTIGNTGSVTSRGNPGSNREGTHLHVSVVELDPAINPNMRRLEDAVKMEDKKAVALWEEIHNKFNRAVGKDTGKKDIDDLRDLLFLPQYKSYVYMNPIEAQWFYKEKN